MSTWKAGNNNGMNEILFKAKNLDVKSDIEEYSGRKRNGRVEVEKMFRKVEGRGREKIG